MMVCLGTFCSLGISWSLTKEDPKGSIRYETYVERLVPSPRHDVCLKSSIFFSTEPAAQFVHRVSSPSLGFDGCG